MSLARGRGGVCVINSLCSALCFLVPIPSFGVREEGEGGDIQTLSLSSCKLSLMPISGAVAGEASGWRSPSIFASQALFHGEDGEKEGDE